MKKRTVGGRIKVTKHAKGRMSERGILVKHVEEVIANPDRVGKDKKGNLLYKKRYHRSGKDRVLIVVCVKEGVGHRILTVIESTKVKKYL